MNWTGENLKGNLITFVRLHLFSINW